MALSRRCGRHCTSWVWFSPFNSPTLLYWTQFYPRMRITPATDFPHTEKTSLSLFRTLPCRKRPIYRRLVKWLLGRFGHNAFQTWKLNLTL